MMTYEEPEGPALVVPDIRSSATSCNNTPDVDGVQLACHICLERMVGAPELLQHHRTCHVQHEVLHVYECSHCREQHRSSISAKRHARSCKQEDVAAFVEEKVVHCCWLCLRGFSDQPSLAAHLVSHARKVFNESLADQCDNQGFIISRQCSDSSGIDVENFKTINLKSSVEKACAGQNVDVVNEDNCNSGRTLKSDTDPLIAAGGKLVEGETGSISSSSRPKRMCHSSKGHRPLYKCALCHLKFYALLAFKGHITRDHPNSKEDLFQCLKCPQTFGSEHFLSAHAGCHNNPDVFSCQKCHKVFKHRHSLRDHMRIHTGERPFLCSECGKTFRLRNDLVKHQIIHSDQRPHACSFCEKTFTTFTAMKRHRRKHTGEKPYSCDICQKRFSCKSDHSKHVRIHSGERPFSCTLCGKSFAWAKCLVKHARVHSDSRPNVCSICGKSFKWPHTLEKHMKNHDNNNEFVKNKKSRSHYIPRSVQKANVGTFKRMISRPNTPDQNRPYSLLKPVNMEYSGSHHNLLHIFLPGQDITAEQLKPYITGTEPQVMLVNQVLSQGSTDSPSSQDSHPHHLISASELTSQLVDVDPTATQVHYSEEGFDGDGTFVEQTSAGLSYVQTVSNTYPSSEQDITLVPATANKKRIRDEFLSQNTYLMNTDSSQVFSMENKKGGIYVFKMDHDEASVQ